MMSYRRAALLHAIIIFATLVAGAIGGTTALAQETDPFMLDAKDRRSASIPTPYGIILGAAQPVARLHYDADKSPITHFDAEAYYDAWQVGIHRRDQGLMASVTFRSVGRERYSGFFVEFGTATVNAREFTGRYDSSEMTSTWPMVMEIDTLTHRSTFLYGVGYKGSFSFAGNNLLNVAYEFAFGNSSTKFGTTSYLHTTIDLGARIPVPVPTSVSALIVGLSVFADITPYSDFKPTIQHSAPQAGLIAGVGIHTRYAFNFGM